MSKGRIEGLKAVQARSLCDQGNQRHENTNETVLEDSEPNNLSLDVSWPSNSGVRDARAHVEPSQTAPRYSPDPVLPSTTPLEPADWEHPILRLYASKVIFLIVEIWRDVVAEEGEKAGDREGLVAVADDFEINRMSIE